MAWRDSRRSKSRLLLFGSSVILGIAALVAIYSLGDNLKRNVDQQAAELIGADLEISGNSLPPPAIQLKMDSMQARTSEERSFASMIYFPQSKGSRAGAGPGAGRRISFYGNPPFPQQLLMVLKKRRQYWLTDH